MVTLLLFGIMISLTLFQYIKFRVSRTRLEKLIDKLPGPRAFPLLGNSHMFIGTPAEVFKRCRKIGDYGSPLRFWLLHKPIVTVFDPENFQILTTKTSEKGDGYGFLKDFLGEGLITSSGDKWKKNRRLLNPAFNPHLLHKHFLSVFNEENDRLLKVLDAEAEKGVQFDAWPHIIRCTLNNITLTAMDYRDELEKGMYAYGESIMNASLLVTKRIYKPWLHPQIVYNLYKRVTGYDKVLQSVHELPKVIIEKKKKEFDLQQKTSHDANFNEIEGKKAKTFIDILLNSSESKAHFSDDQLADEIVTIIMAGSETTAVTVCTTLVMLAMNQHHQERVYDEIQNVLGDHPGNAEIEHLHQFQFLEQCIKETLRRFSVAPFIFRNVTEDVQLKDGKLLPAGTTVLLSIAMLHVNPEVYANPLEWNPDNFSSEAIANRHPCSFVPFSNGHRSCIGAKYALLSIKVMLVTLLRRYKFYSDAKMNDLRPTFDIVMRNLKGYPIRLEKRS